MPSRSKSLLPKIVRFAYKDSMYTIPANPPRAPQPANSDDTPPTRTYALPPTPARPSRRGSLPAYTSHNNSYREYYSPPHNNNHIYVLAHRYLSLNGIAWDVRDPPTTITRSGHAISGRALYEPACGPAQSFMRITLTTSAGAQLPWSVKVYASPDTGFVTLEDVVLAVHAALRVNITASNYSLLRGKDDQTRAVRAYEDRYRRLRSERAYQEEKRAGMKRVDFLMGRIRWIGLEQNKGLGADEWILRLG
ncbi:hypothetical protein D9619_000006 [Psilocybe cf. subviscida]|uniref:DUF6699 domain-containing protein n=1 Tax=Psilocybe cf. subviscida TaxID=2480587 RepID=A0A8H5BCC9_9AGAR|nr:hypothetical protein D9619_000006 [Psilocybe cf. subviscida]